MSVEWGSRVEAVDGRLEVAGPEVGNLGSLVLDEVFVDLDPQSIVGLLAGCVAVLGFVELEVVGPEGLGGKCGLGPGVRGGLGGWW